MQGDSIEVTGGQSSSEDEKDALQAISRGQLACKRYSRLALVLSSQSSVGRAQRRASYGVDAVAAGGS